MLCSICSELFDVDGVVVAERAASNSGVGLSVSRRVAVTPTLDGGVTLDDLGFSGADDEIALSFPLADSLFDRLNYLISTHAALTLSDKSGFYGGALTSVSVSGGAIAATFQPRFKV